MTYSYIAWICIIYSPNRSWVSLTPNEGCQQYFFSKLLYAGGPAVCLIHSLPTEHSPPPPANTAKNTLVMSEWRARPSIRLTSWALWGWPSIVGWSAGRHGFNLPLSLLASWDHQVCLCVWCCYMPCHLSRSRQAVGWPLGATRMRD